MKIRRRFPRAIILAAVLIFYAVFSGCSEVKEADNNKEIAPIWVAVKSIDGDDGIFAEGQGFKFTLCFGYQVTLPVQCPIAEITVKNTADEETRTFVIDDFSDIKYYKRYKDSSAETLELSYPPPSNQPCTGTLEIEIRCFENEAKYQMGEDYCGTSHCAVIYLAESGVGTIIGYMGIDELWEKRCNILLAKGNLTQDEYNSDMHRLQGGACTSIYRRGVSSNWIECDLNGGGDVSFIETADDGGVASGAFSTTTSNETVMVSYLKQLDSGWCDISPERLYEKHKQLFYLTVETENGVVTWFLLYNDGKLTLSSPVSGWCSDINGDTINIADSQTNGAATTYMFSDDMALLELETNTP